MLKLFSLCFGADEKGMILLFQQPLDITWSAMDLEKIVYTTLLYQISLG